MENTDYIIEYKPVEGEFWVFKQVVGDYWNALCELRRLRLQSNATQYRLLKRETTIAEERI